MSKSHLKRSGWAVLRKAETNTELFKEYVS